MVITKVKNRQDGFKVFLDDGREYDIPYLPTTFLYKETKLYIDNGGAIEPEITQLEQGTKDKSEFRIQRDLLLQEADIEINKLFDANIDITLWKTYRQSLRDSTIAWILPIKPQGL